MTNDSVLAAMTSFAESRRLEGGAAPGALRLIGDSDAYIRVSGSGYRAVSVSPDAPLCRYATGPTRDLQKALAQAAGSPRRFALNLSKDERCVQAHLIRVALSRGGDLLNVLGAELPLDELRFAFDEVRLHSGNDGASGRIVRCDLLAVARRSALFEPVLIELKFNRGETRLVELDDFVALMRRHRQRFEAMLSAATGRRVTADVVHRIIVWPSHHPNTSKKKAQVERMAAAGIHCVGYTLSTRKDELPRVSRVVVERASRTASAA